MITTCFFDLGNVLVSFSHDKMWRQLSQVCQLPEQTLKDLCAPLWPKYECGHLSTEEVFSYLQNFAPISIAYKEVALAASDIFEERPEMTKLLYTLKKNSLQLILVSNTCDIHYNHLRKLYSFFDLFDHLILSYELRIAKPSSGIFQKALEKAQLLDHPHHGLFIDDIAENVLSAQQLGIQGHVFKDVVSLQQEFIKLKVKL